jgi:hypothetical protein
MAEVKLDCRQNGKIILKCLGIKIAKVMIAIFKSKISKEENGMAKQQSVPVVTKQKYPTKQRICRECRQPVPYAEDAALLKAIVRLLELNQKRTSIGELVVLAILKRCAPAKHLFPKQEPHCEGSFKYIQYLVKNSPPNPGGVYSEKEAELVRRAYKILKDLAK